MEYYCSCGVSSGDPEVIDRHLQNVPKQEAHQLCTQREYILFEWIHSLQEEVTLLRSRLALCDEDTEKEMRGRK